MRRVILAVLLTALLTGSATSIILIREVAAASQFLIKNLIQVTDGSSFNRPGSLIRNANGSFLLYSACCDPTAGDKHYLEVSLSQNGSIWSNPQRLPFTPNCVFPSAIQDHNGMYWLAWEHQHNGADSILIANSSNGVVWSDPFQVSSGVNCRPSLMQDRNGVYWVAYEDNSWGPEDIIVRSSADGANWSAPIYVTERGDDYCDLMASMIQDSDGTYWILMARVPPVWDGGSRIWSSHSQDGITWSTPVKIETGMASYWPQLAQGSRGSYVMVWKEFCYSASGGDNIWISRSDDCLQWKAPQRLTDREENSLLTCLLVSGEEYYVVYDVWEGNEETIWLMVVKEAPVPPVARFTYSPKPCLLDGEMTFDASASYDLDGHIVSYRWDFGDGSTAEGSTATHSYSSAGNYTVTLMVVDNDNRASTTSQVLRVNVETAFRGPIVIYIQGSRTVAGQGVAVGFNVGIENLGAMTETYDLTLLTGTTVIATFENITQPGETLTTLSATWDTTGVAAGFYTINTQITNHRGETDTIHAYNLEVCVSIRGDVDGNFGVDIYDIVLTASVYGLQNTAPLYNPNCDTNGDGSIDIFDIVTVASNYGNHL
jgi:PKD repeat protein